MSTVSNQKRWRTHLLLLFATENLLKSSMIHLDFDCSLNSFRWLHHYTFEFLKILEETSDTHSHSRPWCLTEQFYRSCPTPTKSCEGAWKWRTVRGDVWWEWSHGVAVWWHWHVRRSERRRSCRQLDHARLKLVCNTAQQQSYNRLTGVVVRLVTSDVDK